MLAMNSKELHLLMLLDELCFLSFTPKPLLLLSFLTEVGSHSPGWNQIHYVTETALEIQSSCISSQIWGFQM